MDPLGHSPQLPPQPTPQQARALIEKEKEEILSTQVKPSRWQYTPLNDVEGSNPSLRDGLDPVKQARWRREFLHLIYKAGTALKV